MLFRPFGSLRREEDEPEDVFGGEEIHKPNKLKTYIRNNCQVCFHCESKRIEKDDPYFLSYEKITVLCYCSECGSEWEEIYRLTSVYDYVETHKR